MISVRSHHQVEKTEKLPSVLIAGGAGFIGAKLCEILLSQNLKVICLDNLSTGKKENIETLLKNPYFKFEEFDLNNESLINKFNVDYIFHLAGVEEFINGIDVSLDTLFVNSIGTKNLLELAKQIKAKFLLVSTLSVYEGLLSNSSINHNFGLSSKEFQKYTHHEAKRFGEALVAEYYRKFNVNCRIVRIADCYGPKMPLEEGSNISKFIKQSLEKNKITIEGEGLDLLYPTYIDDVIFGIQKAMFFENTSGEIYSLINNEGITEINLAYTLQKIFDKKVEIEFISASNDVKFPKKILDTKKTETELGWIAKTNTEEGLKKTIEFFQSKTNGKKEDILKRTEEKNEIPQQEKNTSAVKEEKNIVTVESITKKIESGDKKKKILFPKLPTLKPKFITLLVSFIIVTFVLTLPILSLGFETFIASKDLKSSQSLLEEGKFVESAKKSQSAQKNFYIAKKTASSLSWFFTILKFRKESSILQDSLEVGENLSISATHIANAAQILSEVKDDLSLGFAPNTEEKITEAVLEMSLADERMSIVQALQQEKNLCPFNNSFCNNANSIAQKIPKLRSVISKSKNVISVLPQIMGISEKKNYLVLMQNNTELRGSGGFIGSYGLIGIDNGKILDVKIEDIYSVDGQLKGKVTPPDEILHFLGQPNWFLRDSNISPDFPLTAKRAMWFFEKETGIKADGVIAIDLTFVKKILSVFGPLTLKDYNVTINSENLFLEAEKQSEVNFFPGSTQKKDFLGNLGRALLLEFNTKGDKKTLSLLETINESIEEKHLQLYADNGEVETVIENINASGSLEDSQCTPIGACQKSTLLISENNFGANKVNFFLNRKIKRTTILGREGELREKVNVSYENNSPTESWPGGSYKNWIQFYVPQGSKLLSLNLGDDKKATISSKLTEDIIKNIKKDELLVIESSQSGKTSWGTLVTIPIKSKKEIELIYELPGKISFNNQSVKVEIVQQKQAGTEKDPFEENFSYPAFLALDSQDQKQAIVKAQEVSYNTDLLIDREITIKLKR